MTSYSINPAHKNVLNSSERATYGAIVSLRHGRTGEHRTLARTQMTAVDALREIVAEVDTWGEGWHIAAISAPPSIYTDLQGARLHAVGGSKDITGVLDHRWTIDPYNAEHRYLQLIGRKDLIAPLTQSLPATEARLR